MVMNIFIVDISGKIPLYVKCLADAVYRSCEQDTSLTCFSPNIEDKRLTFPIVKLHYVHALNKYHGIKRFFFKLFKVMSILYNYIVLGWHIRKCQPTILHLEWLPLLDYVVVEKYILAVFKYLAPSMKVIYTIHNVYPHDMSEKKKDAYKRRFMQMQSLIDSFVTHTNSTKKEVEEQFGILRERIVVIPHGIFKLDTINLHKRTNTNEGKIAFIMYGNMSHYKGTDLLVESLTMLPEKYKKSIRVTIAGRIETDFYKMVSEIKTGVEIKWMPFYLDDDMLLQVIIDSDAILLPYRVISQSGVLLLALSFGKVILTSDLPSFKETLEGYDDNMFFRAGNAKSLTDLIVRYIEEKIDVDKALLTIDRLERKYSWENVARLTCNVYNSNMRN